MENKKNLEGKVGNAEGIMDMDLIKLVGYLNLRTDKALSARYVEGMIGHLYCEDGVHYRKGVRKVRDLYGLSENDIGRMSMYGKKTFLKLNELLTGKGLPALQLPKEYTSYPQTSG